MKDNIIWKNIFFIVIIIMAITASPIYALDDIMSAGDDFLSQGKLEEDVINTTALKNTSNKIFNMLLAIAVVIAVAIGTILGIKFITSSVEGQAKIKEALIPYFAGCIVVFAAFPIWSFVVNSGKDVAGVTSSGDVILKLKHYETTVGCNLEEGYTKEQLHTWNVDENILIYKECSGCHAVTMFNKEKYTATLFEFPNCSCGERLELYASDILDMPYSIEGYDVSGFITCKSCEKKNLVKKDTGKIKVLNSSLGEDLFREHIQEFSDRY